MIYLIIRFGQRRSSISQFSLSVKFFMKIRPPDMCRRSNDHYAPNNDLSRENIVLVSIIYHIIRFGPRRSSFDHFSPNVHY